MRLRCSYVACHQCSATFHCYGLDRASLRERINGVYDVLCTNGGRLVLDLCEAFGIPDHLLQVCGPVKSHYRDFGTVCIVICVIAGC